MGADLYLRSRFEPNQKRWREEFDRAVAERDRLPDPSPERTKAQELVSEYFGKMYEEGYFRDSYNDSNLLWQFGLSWWDDVGALLEPENQELTTEGAERLRALLKEREDVFEDNVSKRPGEEQAYFRAAYDELRTFLTVAIDTGEAVYCSI